MVRYIYKKTTGPKHVASSGIGEVRWMGGCVLRPTICTPRPRAHDPRSNKNKNQQNMKEQYVDNLFNNTSKILCFTTE